MFRAAVFSLLLLTACAQAPEQGAPVANPPDDGHPYQATYHDDERALDAVRILSSDELEGRRTGEPGNRKAQDWIVSRLRALGVSSLYRDGYRVPFAAGKFDAPSHEVRGTNILAAIPGQAGDEAPVIVMSAHFDHLGVYDGAIYNGADDNASGVSALLESIAWFRRNPPESTIVFAFFDAEEQGFGGSVSFLAALPQDLRARLALNLNLDMVARADEGELYAIGAYHEPALVPLIDKVAAEAPITLLRGHDSPDWGDQDWSYQSDHAPFLRAGLPVIYLGVEDHADYHQPSDEVDRIDAEIFARCVDTIIMMAEAADNWVASRDR